MKIIFLSCFILLTHAKIDPSTSSIPESERVLKSYKSPKAKKGKNSEIKSWKAPKSAKKAKHAKKANEDEDDNNPGTEIVGGDPVYPKDRYPYQVALVDSAKQYCAGSLIAPGWVLSAAHCPILSQTRVQIGRWNIADNSEVYEEIRIDAAIRHPDYNKRTYDNDFMLLRLNTDSQYPPVSIDDGSRNLPSGTNVTVMGWGTIRSGGPSPDILLEAEVDIVSNIQCESDYADKGYDITDNMLCAARAGKDACQGDSGGPLIVKGTENDDDVLVGVVSWGFGCATSYPGVYARVSKAHDWITRYLLGEATLAPTNSPSTGAPTISPAPTNSPITRAPTVSPAPTSSCRYFDEDLLEIQLRTDLYAFQTSIKLVNQNNEILVEEKGFENSTQYTFRDCVQLNCYTFTIYDSYGDGICCSNGQGSYSVTYRGIPVASGGIFGYEESTKFGFCE